jgi:hypothetical protein
MRIRWHAFLGTKAEFSERPFNQRDSGTDGSAGALFAREGNKETSMKTIVAGLFVAAMATSAYAQSAAFYVVHEPSTKKCTIVTSKPTTTTTTIVDGKTFKTRVEAETAMKTMKVCTTN